MLINNLNHKNLTSNVPFDELPKWFQKAHTKNAIVNYIDGIIHWINGIWESGIWFDGIWFDGTWIKGIWLNGIWYNGTWFNGTWFNGTWFNGIWFNGTWINGKWFEGKWFDGYRQIKIVCEWSIYYSYDNIRIGCITKTTKEWDKWFAGTEEFKTKRNTDKFHKIYENFLNAKEIQKIDFPEK